ncbi:MAG: hypothetical protein J6333_06590 [Planctomycetes bacterium]|nr:hypothetical protein [Planctomycetota bacterium]
MNNYDVKQRLLFIYSSMKKQVELKSFYGGNTLSFDEEMSQIYEYIHDACEYSTAYESIVANLEEVPFVVPSKVAICLLEVGLLMGYKTDREEDRCYDRR